MAPTTNEVHINLNPYPLQREILFSPAKRKVIAAGRRAGKTTMATYAAVIELLQNKRVFLSSASQDQADAFWDKSKTLLADLIACDYLYKNETKRLLTTPAGGQLRVKTGSNPDRLRGDYSDLIVLDECALLPTSIWDTVVAPMLADTGGTAIFISTPKRRNWFYYLFVQARNEQEGENPIWAAWNFASHANPYLEKDSLDQMAADMGGANSDYYRQEILAEFLEDSGSVFRNVRGCADSTFREPYVGQFAIGIDWGMTNDYTVAVVLDINTLTVVDVLRFNNIDWALQREKIIDLYNRWGIPSRDNKYSGVQFVYAEANSIGGPNVEALQRAGVPVVAFQMTATSKPQLIESLVLSFDRCDIHVLNDETLLGRLMIEELLAYERTVNSVTGRSSYSAPTQTHDDCVIALAIAHWAVMNRRYAISIS